MEIEMSQLPDEVALPPRNSVQATYDVVPASPNTASLLQGHPGKLITVTLQHWT